jgi:uncharacterized protein (DUF983 family)
MVLFCCVCGAENLFTRNWIEADDACQACQSRGRWKRYNDPTVDYTLTDWDRAFLKTQRILVE